MEVKCKWCMCTWQSPARRTKALTAGGWRPLLAALNGSRPVGRQTKALTAVIAGGFLHGRLRQDMPASAESVESLELFESWPLQAVASLELKVGLPPENQLLPDLTHHMPT